MTQPSLRTSPNPTRVLLVDDEPEVTEGLARVLMDEPYEFLEAHSGAEALDFLAREPIDIIVSDDQMPGMQGTELLTRVRYAYPNVIRIILTGHASVQSAMKAIHEGWIYQYLHKPCHAADLAAVLYTAMLLRSLAPPPNSPEQCTEVNYQKRLLQSLAHGSARTDDSEPPPSFSVPQWSLE
jgi:DNA-binding NtrC family response regulator